MASLISILERVLFEQTSIALSTRPIPQNIICTTYDKLDDYVNCADYVVICFAEQFKGVVRGSATVLVSGELR